MEAKYIGLILIIFLSFLAGCHTLNGEFVSDDFVLLEAAENVGILQMFTSNWLGERGEGGFYRPMVLASWKLDRLLYGANPRGYHFTNILLHVTITVMAYLLIWMFTKKLRVALPAAALFAIHPIHVEAIAWISGRTDTVTAFFYLLSMLCFLKSSEKKDSRQNNLKHVALVSGICAMLSKEIALTLPIVITTMDILYRRMQRAESFRKGYTPYFIALATILLVRYFALGSFVGGYGSDTHLRFGVIFRYMIFYIQFFLEPFGMPGNPASLYRWVLLAGFLMLSVMAFFSDKTVAGATWFWLVAIPVLTICRPQYMYLPSLGLFWVTAVIVFDDESFDRPEIKQFMWSIIWIVFMLIFIMHTFELNKQWSQLGWTGKSIEKVFRAVYPDVDPDQRFVVINPPASQRLNVGVFQNGLQQAVRLWYDDSSLEAVRLAVPEQYTDRHPDRDIVFQFDNDKIVDLTDYYKGVADARFLWPESPVEIVLEDDQTLDLAGLDISITGIEILSQLSHSTDVTNETPIARINVRFQDGRNETHYLQVGVHTSEWAYDRNDVRERVIHDRAPIAFSYFGSVFPATPFPGHTYSGLIPFNQPGVPASVSIQSLTQTIQQIEDPVKLSIRMINAVNNQAD